MPAVRRWRFTGGGEQYTVPQNPASMSSLFPTRNVTARTTTGGRVLLTEGATPPQSWSFEGSCRTKAHYEALRHWVYDIKQRVVIRDHFGRDIECVLLSFDAKPKRSLDVYWRHEYSISALVISVTAPTVGEAG